MTDLLTKLALTSQETLEDTINCLSTHISLDTKGAFDIESLFQILVRAASCEETIEQTSKGLKNCPSSNNIRYNLSKIEDFKQLEAEINSALKSRIPKGLNKKKQTLAIDLNLIPYYGKQTEKEHPYIYRSQAKNGTCSFYAYATLYVIKKGKRVTLGIRGVRWVDTKAAIITYLLAELSDLNIYIKKLYLDREVFSVAVISWLMALDVPFVMPAIKRGKTGGINQFLKGKKSYKTKYTMSSQKGKSVTFELWIVCRYKKGKRGKKGVEYLVYVVYKVKTSLAHIRQSYRQGFGIESSYRLKNTCRIRTTTKNPIVRLLFVGISFLLVNIWVNFLWQRISQPRRGGRLIYRNKFPLKLMLSFLRQAVDQIFNTVKEISIPMNNIPHLSSNLV
ncbi:MAG: ISH3 family transposase [Crocosphaera sp.]|nr:ISH3 family transposase [Crocosphaera sp.]